MCNKQRRSFKNNIRISKFFQSNFAAVLIFIFIVAGCDINDEPAQQNEVIKTVFPEIAQHITERNHNELLRFTTHENKDAASLAWRAIAKAAPDDIDEFLNYVVEHDSHEAWFALSRQSLSENHIEKISDLYREGKIESEGVCELFFKHGGEDEIQILLSDENRLLNSELCAKAVGGISVRVPLQDFDKRTIFDLAFASGDFTIQRNLLYGFYRAALNRPRDGDPLKNALLSMIENRGEQFSPELDEYLVRITGKPAFENVMQRRILRDLNNHVQLSNELARNLVLYSGDNLPEKQVITLLRHKTPNVRAQVLESLHELDQISPEILKFVEEEITRYTRNSEVFVRSLELLQKNDVDIKYYLPKLEFIEQKNAHLQHRVLPLYAEYETRNEYLDRLKGLISGGGIRGLRAAQALSNYFMNDIENRELAEKIRELVFYALDQGDRSVVSVLNVHIRNRELISNDDFEKLYKYYNKFLEKREWTKADDIGEALQIRFPEKFEPEEIEKNVFLNPDWDRLFELGMNPYWILETEKGTIEIELDPLGSPFTVSSIDSLSTSGKYNDVPFHRIVRNFVIQGGDFDRKDGFGGPEYRIPTEPSIKPFERGMVGVASSGTDTEGSQFFIMHQWAPHLDGDYTIFGEVKRGMNVVDQIQIGDKILKATISVR